MIDSNIYLLYVVIYLEVKMKINQGQTKILWQFFWRYTLQNRKKFSIIFSYLYLFIFNIFIEAVRNVLKYERWDL